MSNQFVDLESRATLLKNKLERLSKSVQNSSSFVTQEAYSAECARILQNFYKDLESPYFNYEEAKRDNTLLPTTNSIQNKFVDYDFNIVWDQVIKSLEILFLEMENVELISISNFNFAMTEAARLRDRMKSVASKLGDYALYSKNTMSDIYIVNESFNNLSRTDMQSSLLLESQCSINEEEGIITLPVKKNESKAISIENSPKINDDSNGVAGNNHEIGSSHNSDISALWDGNSDTWYEYERVVSSSSENDPPLILDMILDLGSPKIINKVTINPNNFGTKTVISIDNIATSLDGQFYTSIKDDIPILGYETEDEVNEFTLAPSTSKYAGQGNYSFIPRKTRFIHFTFRQTEPYTIETSTGTKLRYAIGLRDIDIKSLKYESKGEFISLPLSSPQEIKKVLLETTQNPLKDSDLTNISYSISHNNGISWTPIQPKQLSGISGFESVPEILNYNNSDVDTIITATPVTSVRLKIVLEREDANFKEGTSSLFKTVATKSEVQPIPTSPPFTISLDDNPLEGSVVMIDPGFGSMGFPDSAYFLKYDQQQSEDTFRGLPFKNIKIPFAKDTTNWMNIYQKPAKDWLYVYVGGERWTQRKKPWDQSLGSDEVKTLFDFNPVKGELSFNPDSNYDAEQPPSDSPISLHFGAERIFPTPQGNDHLAELQYPTSNSREDVTITRYGEKISITGESIRQGATKHNLKYSNIDLDTNPSIAGYTLVDFINGSEELNLTTNFSIDNENGIIYLGSPAPYGSTCTYSYTPKFILSNEDWDWNGNDPLRKTISIKEAGWVENKKDDQEMQIAGKMFGVKHTGIVKGTFKPPKTSGGVSHENFFKEVAYIDGTTEFAGANNNGSKQYSIDYSCGIGYLSDSCSDTLLTCSYSYANYEASYRIARTINPEHYDVDVTNGQITLRDGEFFKYREILNTTQRGRATYYLINYDYVAETVDDVQELKDYFTPVVKDYILKILKKGVSF